MTENKGFSCIRAVVFDKDGTLIDFDKFWVSVSERALADLLSSLGIAVPDSVIEEIMTAFGVTGGVTDIDGVLCRGTYRQMSDIVGEILSSHGFDIDREGLHSALLSAYGGATEAGVIAPTCEGLYEALSALCDMGLRLAVVTTDNEPITRKCLDKLGILPLFDKIYCDGGAMPTKPDPAAIHDFCLSLGIKPSEVLMVGDTMTDVRFARAAGASVVGVSKNGKNRERLSSADKVICELSELPALLGGGI